MDGRTLIEQFIVEQQRDAPGATGELAAVLADLVSAFKAIAAAVGKGGIAGLLGDAASSNAGGERQKKLDVVANEILLRTCEQSGHLAGIASEELDEVYPCRAARPGAPYVLALDPLDGSSNLDVNVSVGTIFSVLRRRAAGPLDPGELLQGLEQVCAGYAIYGPSMMLVLTLGHGVHGFTLDRELGELVLTHPDLRIPAESREFAVNASNERFWEPPVRRYVTECLAGRTGPRGDDFNMRWIASLVAEVHRILVRGGVFMYPRDAKLPARAGRLRLLYEARPMAMLVEQAGGAASTGRGRLLDVAAVELHQRVPVILGSRAEVERLARYHREHDENGQPFSDPLFNVRTLFRA
jgi:fructose-1,6-bisphosphatase I/sedoheptulose-1,7-bisphosphatase/fructose-1,6-bisphosphatase I